MTTVKESQCAIWPSYAAKKWQESIVEDKTYYDSPRAGGGYAIFEDAEEKLRYDDALETLFRVKARMTTWLVEMRQQGEEWPLVTTDVIGRVTHVTHDLIAYERGTDCWVTSSKHSANP